MFGEFLFLLDFLFQKLLFRKCSNCSTLTMPSIIQAAFFLESLINVPAIVSLIFYPKSTIRPALAANASLSAAELNQTATLLARCAGVLILALTPQLLLALPDSKDCAGKRKQVYVRHFSELSLLIRDFFSRRNACCRRKLPIILPSLLLEHVSSPEL